MEESGVDNRQRYRRQIMLPEIGIEGQRKIRAAKVFVAGMGGLGSAAAYYLCAAGVGRLGIIDNDMVDISNLQRQILHHTGRIGKPKVFSAAQTLKALNPDVEIIAFNQTLVAKNARDLVSDYDMVLDCCDNFSTRYILNDACIYARKPLIYGAVQGFEGQVMTIIPGEGPCYRCLYPEPPESPAATPNRQPGVIGVLPGVIGLVQASEALKLILGQGKLLTGRLMLYDMLSMEFYKFKIIKNSGCISCGCLEKSRGINNLLSSKELQSS